MRSLTLLFFVATIQPGFGQRPPVVLVDGYHLRCQGDITHDFGDLQVKLQVMGLQVKLLATCAFSGKPPIEELGNALGTMIRDLNVPEVDLVSHSMGGLIVRSYLSGKQSASGVFRPPANARVRKWVSIATPNFGALIPGLLFGLLPDVQARALSPGSQFLFDLATWNQNHDDLRGVDAIGIIGNAGGFGPFESASDGIVALTSASMSFAVPDERTRILPYCHGEGSSTAILGLGCDAPPIAKIQSDNPLAFQIIDSFLSGREDWKTIGLAPSQDKYLSRFGGILSQSRDNVGRPAGSIRDQNFVANPPAAGTYAVVIDKPGPRIALIIPSAARLPFLSLAPRMLISIYGDNLSGSTVTVNERPLVLNYASERQLNALLPDNVLGLVKLTVSNTRGSETINVFVEEAVPAVFTMNGSGSGVAAAIRTGDFVSLYLTGLGNGVKTTVTLNGTPATVQYAGPAPGFPGLDQINIQVPPGTASGTIVVLAGKRASNVVTLPPT